jgi:hypothetical protein
MGSGHHHADEGMFYFSALGVNWITESPFSKTYDGKYHNLVLIDGISEPDGPPARAKYLGASLSNLGAFGSADLSYAYSWRWCTQVMMWTNDWMTTRSGGKGWELETDPDILAYYQGTERYKMRPWWPTYTFSNFMPTVRAPYNPVKYVYRSAGILRGTHPYGLVIDDAKKDDSAHLYQWTASMGQGVWQARSGNLPKNQILLASHTTDKTHHAGDQYLRPRNGEPVLLLCALGNEESGVPAMKPVEGKTLEGPDGGPWAAQSFYDIASVNLKAAEAHFKILLIPMKYGEPLPDIKWDAKTETAQVSWKEQSDMIKFTRGADGRTKASVSREGKTVAETK